MVIDYQGEGFSLMYELNKTLIYENLILYDATKNGINKAEDLKHLANFFRTEKIKLIICGKALDNIEEIRKLTNLPILDFRDIMRNYCECKNVKPLILDCGFLSNNLNLPVEKIEGSFSISKLNKWTEKYQADFILTTFKLSAENRKQIKVKTVHIYDFWTQELKKYLALHKKKRKNKTLGTIAYYNPKY